MAEAAERPKILIVDDDAAVCEHLEGLLRHAGFVPVSAKDGASALATLSEEEDVALMLLDRLMPIMDGMAVLAELSMQPVPPPVIMLTAQAGSPEVKAALDAGAADFIEKPLQREALLYKINTILGREPEGARRQAARRRTVNLRAGVSLVVRDIREDGCELESSFPMPQGSVAFLQSEGMSLRLDLPLDHRFSLRVEGCVGKGNAYTIQAEFVGLTPALRDRITEVCRSSGW